MSKSCSAAPADSSRSSTSMHQASAALTHMVEALESLDQAEVDDVIGAHLDHAIESLKDWISRQNANPVR